MERDTRLIPRAIFAYAGALLGAGAGLLIARSLERPDELPHATVVDRVLVVATAAAAEPVDESEGAADVPAG